MHALHKRVNVGVAGRGNFTLFDCGRTLQTITSGVPRFRLLLFEYQLTFIQGTLRVDPGTNCIPPNFSWE